MSDRKEKNKERASYKTIATSIGMKEEWQEVRSYMQTELFKESIARIKIESNDIEDADAYIILEEQKILNRHFSKHEKLENTLLSLKSKLGEISETIKKEGSKWIVYSEKEKRKLGEHDSKEAAEKQLKAIHISQHRS